MRYSLVTSGANLEGVPNSIRFGRQVHQCVHVVSAIRTHPQNHQLTDLQPCGKRIPVWGKKRRSED